MKKLFFKLSPDFLKRWLSSFFIRRYRKNISNKSVTEVFEYIHQKKIWGNKESISGSGSSKHEAQQIIEKLPKILEKYQINSMLDLPCGDFNWMQYVDLKGVKYIGGEIVKNIIDSNNLKFSKENIHFKQLNIIEDSLPSADLILCRDCFVHLSNEQIKLSLENIIAHKFKYLLVTSFPKTTFNKNILTGEWRPLNMEIEPFNFTAIEIFSEKKYQKNGELTDKSLVLIDLNHI